MTACKRHSRSSRFSVASILSLALAASACTIQTTTSPNNDPPKEVPATPETPEGSKPPAVTDPNDKVTEIVVVGTNVTSTIYVSGDLGLTTIPKDLADQAVLSTGLKVQIAITSPVPMTVDVSGTECTAPDDKAKPTAIGVILDDSGSMGSSDPTLLRKDATVSFLNTLGASDQVLLTDYGATGSNLRDLLCTSNGGAVAACSPPTAAFTSDKPALIKATEQIKAIGGTPLYESCVQMVPLVDSVKDKRRAILLLSDGAPNSQTQRDACHAAAKTAQIPVFTVGLGPAAEGDPKVLPSAVKVLRELSTDTNGGYASANDPTQLDQLFKNMGTALARGSCRTTAKVQGGDKIVPGSTIKGEVTIGNKSAKASFEFVAPGK
jgi:hypothetical protein